MNYFRRVTRVRTITGENRHRSREILFCIYLVANTTFQLIMLNVFLVSQRRLLYSVSMRVTQQENWNVIMFVHDCHAMFCLADSFSFLLGSARRRLD